LVPKSDIGYSKEFRRASGLDGFFRTMYKKKKEKELSVTEVKRIIL
jgi:hypothetical protein